MTVEYGLLFGYIAMVGLIVAVVFSHFVCLCVCFCVWAVFC